MIYTYQSVTHPGKRVKNEDDFHPRQSTTQNNVFIVSDGLGGHGDGDLAATFVTDQLAAELQKLETLEGDHAISALRRVDKRLHQYAQKVGNIKMGSTTAFVKFDKKCALVGWVGDSRIYQFRNGQIRFRSTDHTIAELMHQNGKLSKEESENIPFKHIIWQAMGTHHGTLQPSIELIPDIEPGDRFLLATDGLTNSCDDNCLSELIMQHERDAAAALHERCEKIAHDNFTFTVIRANKAH